MKKLIDAVYLLLPPIAGNIIIAILLDFQPAKVSAELMIMGAVCSFLGVPMILFYKNIANWSARIHSFWHPVYYTEDKKTGEDELRQDECRRKKISYRRNSAIDCLSSEVSLSMRWVLW